MSVSDVPEVLSVQVVPSGEVRMVPESPTVTNNPVEVVVVPSSLLLLQEMMVKLKRRRIEMRIISRCFIWFPIGVLGEPNIYQNLVWITMCGGFTW